MNISKKAISNYSYFLISTKNEGKVFEIKGNGSVYFTKNGKYQEAKTDKLLGHALGGAIIAMGYINRESINKANKKHGKN